MSLVPVRRLQDLARGYSTSATHNADNGLDYLKSTGRNEAQSLRQLCFAQSNLLKHLLFQPLLDVQMNQDQTTPFTGLSIATFPQIQLSKSLHHMEFFTTSVISTTGGPMQLGRLGATPGPLSDPAHTRHSSIHNPLTHSWWLGLGSRRQTQKKPAGSQTAPTEPQNHPYQLTAPHSLHDADSLHWERDGNIEMPATIFHTNRKESS